MVDTLDSSGTEAAAGRPRRRWIVAGAKLLGFVGLPLGCVGSCYLADTRRLDDAEPHEKLEDAPSWWPSWLPHRNAPGQWIAARYAFYEYGGAELANAHMRAVQLCTRAAVAVRRHELRQGALPATLAEIVPAFFERVPEDPFDGQPLRYSQGARRIYSVGRDFADDGGAVTDDEVDPAADIGVSF